MFCASIWKCCDGEERAGMGHCADTNNHCCFNCEGRTTFFCLTEGGAKEGTGTSGDMVMHISFDRFAILSCSRLSLWFSFKQHGSVAQRCARAHATPSWVTKLLADIFPAMLEGPSNERKS